MYSPGEVGRLRLDVLTWLRPWGRGWLYSPGWGWGVKVGCIHLVEVGRLRLDALTDWMSGGWGWMYSPGWGGEVEVVRWRLTVLTWLRLGGWGCKVEGGCRYLVEVVRFRLDVVTWLRPWGRGWLYSPGWGWGVKVRCTHMVEAGRLRLDVLTWLRLDVLTWLRLDVLTWLRSATSMRYPSRDWQMDVGWTRSGATERSTHTCRRRPKICSRELRDSATTRLSLSRKHRSVGFLSCPGSRPFSSSTQRNLYLRTTTTTKS